ncbi:Histone deacetylase hda1 [Ascosphaera acerosa]|nr:Histone deacetylase hda1 [Ascosphaera acerosa]
MAAGDLSGSPATAEQVSFGASQQQITLEHAPVVKIESGHESKPGGQLSRAASGPQVDILEALDAKTDVKFEDYSLKEGSSFKCDSADEESDGSIDEEHAYLPRASLPSGLCYDDRMRYHCEVQPETDYHPEDPRRIYYIYREICKAGLADDPKSRRPLVHQPLKRIPAREATIAEVTMVHTPEHFDFVKSTRHMTEHELKWLEDHRDSIYFNNLTYQASLLSCGGAIETCKAVVSGKVKNAVAVIRPPGHHAEHDKTMGFCVFNNVCVAARACQQEFGESCRKVLILDWDVHHGNGTQQAFYEDPNVLYISLHVYRNGSFYPGGDEGDLDHCGEGAGLGKNVNIPWPTQGMSDGDYLYAFQHVVMPIALEFDPDLVIISAGFDAAAGDELGGCFVTPPCYAHMTHMLMSLAGGKVAVCLEGGYNFRSISRSALAVTRTLMGEPPDRLSNSTASKEAVSLVEEVKMEQSRYWRCLYPKPAAPIFRSNPLQDVLRQYQAKKLYEDFKMTSLYIYRDYLSVSFENEVLATPELLGIANPVTNTLEAHNAWMADLVKDYIAWAQQNDIAVVDVHVPKRITKPQVSPLLDDGIAQANANGSPGGLRVSDATHIFLLGIGDAYQGLSSLLINDERVYAKVTGVISLVADNPVRSLASSTNPWLSRWYRDNSLVFIWDGHLLWRGHKLSKRYGRIRSAPEKTLNEMLSNYQQVITDFILDRIEVPSDIETSGSDDEQ